MGTGDEGAEDARMGEGGAGESDPSLARLKLPLLFNSPLLFTKEKKFREDSFLVSLRGWEGIGLRDGEGEGDGDGEGEGEGDDEGEGEAGGVEESGEEGVGTEAEAKVGVSYSSIETSPVRFRKERKLEDSFRERRTRGSWGEEGCLTWDGDG
jgi:hypothetical protein